MSTTKYGRVFETDSLLSIELYMFRINTGADRTQRFIGCCKEIWPSFEWNEWALEMAAALCEQDISGFTSGASSGKSEIMAKFALVSWFADPVHTLVIACSTTASDAKQKIWGHIVRNFREARAAKKSVGNIIESMAIIKLSEKTDGMAASDNSSICLVAAGNEFKDDALKRLQGRHQKHVILILDELQDCSQEIITTALGNLSANERFEVHVAGNASSRFDSHGLFMTPVEGWTTVNRNTHKWQIKVGGKIGLGIHFDCTRDDSPNMIRAAQGRDQLKFLRKAEEILVWRESYGENSATFLRQFVGFWPDSEGESNYIVTDVALTVHQAYDRAEWRSPPVNIAGIDPSYSVGGDRFVLFHLKYGLTTHGVWTVEFFEAITIKPRIIPGETKDHANLRECRRICEEREISTQHIGIDSSAGSSFISIAHKDWSPMILGVQFGGAPSDLPVGTFDKRIASDLYANRTSELAYVFVEFMNAGQVRGIKPDHAKELTARQYEIVAGDKTKIESKEKMKKRLGFSPDIADAGHIGLDVIRTRLKIMAGANTVAAANTGGDWNRLKRKMDISSRSEEAMRQMARSRFQ